ncbi:MAG: hypothetical protein JXA49_07235 [Actinobacteria bacterium]|nr:hypothetical protein [Actinomycetota bacterium]
MERAAEIKARFKRPRRDRGLKDTVSRVVLSIFFNMIARRIRKKHALKKEQKKADKVTAGLKLKGGKVPRELERKAGPGKRRSVEFRRRKRDLAGRAEKKKRKSIVLLFFAAALLLVMVSRMPKRK